MKTYKNGIKAIVFILIFIFLFQSITYILRPARVKRIQQGFYYEKKDSLDVVLLGASQVHANFDPWYAYKKFKIYSYDFSMDSQPFFLRLPTLKEALKSQSQALYIIDLRNLTDFSQALYLNEEAFRLTVDGLDHSLNRIRTIHRFMPSADLTFYFDLVKYHQEWKNLSADFFDEWDNRRYLKSKGYAFLCDYQQKVEPNYKLPQGDHALSEEAEKNLYELLEYCRHENVRVLFMISPFIANDPDVEYGILDHAKNIIRSYGFDVLDGNENYSKMNLDFTSDFNNRYHLNVLGAEKFTDFIGNYILERGYIDEKEEIAADQNWDKDLEWYENYMKWCREEIKKALREREISDGKKQ